MKLQHQKDLAIAIAAILAIAVILAIAANLAISGHKEKPQLSSATLLEEVVLNYIYSKLRTIGDCLSTFMMRIVKRDVGVFPAIHIRNEKCKS
jgi:hypothetical protein